MTTDGAPRAEASEASQRPSTPHATSLHPPQHADAAADQVSRPEASQGSQKTPSTERQVPPESTGFQPITDDRNQTVAVADGGCNTDRVNSHLPIVQEIHEMKRVPRAAAAAANAHMAEQAVVEDAPFNVVVARALSAQQAPKPAADKGTKDKLDVAVEEEEEKVAPAIEPPNKRPSRAAAAAANANMAEQVKEEEAPLGVVMAKALSEQKPAVEKLKKDELAAAVKDEKEALAAAAEQPSKRPSRAASAAANALMAAQTKEEDLPLGVLVASALVDPLKPNVDEQNLKKRSTDLAAAPAAKRSRVTATTASKQVKYNTLEEKSAELNQPSRGKKRRQAPVYEAAPIITDLPPLPFTSSSPDVKGKGKSKPSAKTKSKEVDGDARYCEFCKKVDNICVLMHCHACRRVYHAQCLWHAFKPYVDEKVPILDQMERLQLEAPERRGNIFRCASCKAAFLDFYESGGYLWECDCPSCAQPEKLVFYRQRKLVQMMNDMELEKQRKRDQKGQKNAPSPVTTGKPPAPAPSRSNSSSRNRRARGSSAIPDEQVVSSRTSRRSTSRSRGFPPEGQDLKKEGDAAKAETMDVKTDVEKKIIVKMEAKAEPLDVAPQQAKGEMVTPEQTKDVAALKVKYEPVGEPEQPELSGDELVGAVRLQRDGKSGAWCFLVMCSRTSSLRESGMMKTGKCKWFPKKAATIECNCCDKMFSYAEFAHHTDSRLVKDAKCAKEDPMPYLFVEHRDNAQYSPIEKFLPALRSWATRQSLNNTPTKSRRSQAAKQEPLAAVLTPAMTMTNPEAAGEALPAALSRLDVLALFKRPKPRSDKTSVAARLSFPATFDFVAQVVCISPKYVMNMANGSLADKVVCSRTQVPGDSFPRKAGWLAFNRNPTTSRQVTCVCCEKVFGFDEFVAHAGITLSGHKMKARQLLYVVERQDESALVPFNTFLPDLELVVKNEADAFLDALQVPPPSPRPI